MERRGFLAGLGAGAAAALPAVALADGPQIKWRLASSFPRSLDTIHGACDTVAQRVAAATGGRFQIQCFAGGELVPATGVLDAVKEGTVQCGHTSSYWYVGKDPAFAFDTAMPFGLNSRQQTAWMMEGGGMDLVRDFLRDYRVVNFPCGNTGSQMGGWYRKEIKSVADLKGLKMRISGLAGQVMARLGVVPQQIPGGEVYAALERGTIDAVEWVGPYDDEKLGFHKVAKHYYFPGWWEGSAQLSIYVNQQEWERLPPHYQAILEDACAHAHAQMQARYDARNPGVLRRLIEAGVLLHRFPTDMMEAAWRETHALYDEIAAKNPRFRKIYEPWRRFRDGQVAWFATAERSYDNFMAAATLGREAAKK